MQTSTKEKCLNLSHYESRNHISPYQGHTTLTPIRKQFLHLFLTQHSPIHSINPPLTAPLWLKEMKNEKPLTLSPFSPLLNPLPKEAITIVRLLLHLSPAHFTLIQFRCPFFKPPLLLSSPLPDTLTNQTPNNQNPIKSMCPLPIILSSSSQHIFFLISYKLHDHDPSKIIVKSSTNENIKDYTRDIKHFNTFNLLDKCSLKITIKGISTGIMDDKIKIELTTLNFEVKYLRRFGSPGKRLLIYLAILAHTPNC